MIAAVARGVAMLAIVLAVTGMIYGALFAITQHDAAAWLRVVCGTPALLCVLAAIGGDESGEDAW